MIWSTGSHGVCTQFRPESPEARQALTAAEGQVALAEDRDLKRWYCTWAMSVCVSKIDWNHVVLSQSILASPHHLFVRFCTYGYVEKRLYPFGSFIDPFRLFPGNNQQNCLYDVLFSLKDFRRSQQNPLESARSLQKRRVADGWKFVTCQLCTCFSFLFLFVFV